MELERTPLANDEFEATMRIVTAEESLQRRLDAALATIEELRGQIYELLPWAKSAADVIVFNLDGVDSELVSAAQLVRARIDRDEFGRVSQ